MSCSNCSPDMLSEKACDPNSFGNGGGAGMLMAASMSVFESFR